MRASPRSLCEELIGQREGECLWTLTDPLCRSRAACPWRQVLPLLRTVQINRCESN